VLYISHPIRAHAVHLSTFGVQNSFPLDLTKGGEWEFHLWLKCHGLIVFTYWYSYDMIRCVAEDKHARGTLALVPLPFLLYAHCHAKLENLEYTPAQYGLPRNVLLLRFELVLRWTLFTPPNKRNNVVTSRVPSRRTVC